MSRVERTENPPPERQRREPQRTKENRRSDSPGHTPGQAEGDERDVEEALRRQSE